MVVKHKSLNLSAVFTLWWKEVWSLTNWTVVMCKPSRYFIFGPSSLSYRYTDTFPELRQVILSLHRKRICPNVVAAGKKTNFRKLSACGRCQINVKNWAMRDQCTGCSAFHSDSSHGRIGSLRRIVIPSAAGFALPSAVVNSHTVRLRYLNIEGVTGSDGADIPIEPKFHSWIVT